MSTSSARAVKNREPISHVDGVPWDRAPLPRRFHRCRAQSSGPVERVGFVEQCACGGVRIDRTGEWMDRNARRKHPGNQNEDLEYIAAVANHLSTIGGGLRG